MLRLCFKNYIFLSFGVFHKVMSNEKGCGIMVHFEDSSPKVECSNLNSGRFTHEEISIEIKLRSH